MMRIIMLGISHRTAHVQVREKLALGGEQLNVALHEFAQAQPRTECVILSTCNRTELYIARPSHAPPTTADLKQYLASLCKQPKELIETCSVMREQEYALRHLFRVTCGLDSMVLGEHQITGQVKKAYEAARIAGTVGPVLHQVFQLALTTSKQLRQTTALRSDRHSIGSVAVEFAIKTFGNIKDKTVLCLGVGDMSRCIIQYLHTREVGKIMLLNRTMSHAQKLADELPQPGQVVYVYDWSRLNDLVHEADIVITATGSSHPIITCEHFKRGACSVRSKPVMIIDIAVPRDVAPEVGSVSNIFLYNIDDLQSVIDRHMLAHNSEIEKCEAQITEAIIDCMAQIRTRDIGRLIRQLRQKLHGLGRGEQQRTLRKLSPLIPPEHPDVVSSILAEHTYRVINKILHLPLCQLDRRNKESPIGFYAAAIRRLFQLEESFLADKAVEDTDDDNNQSPFISEQKVDVNQEIVRDLK